VTGRPRIHIVVPGTRYGKRTIVREDGHINIHRAALVRCDCGGVDRVAIHQLRNGNTDGCWRCGVKSNRPAVQVGERFGSRVVTGEAPDSHGKQRVTVRCDCGTEGSVIYGVLIRDKPQKCPECARRSLMAMNRAKRVFDRNEIQRLIATGMMNKDIAKVMGCSAGYVSEVKTGRKKP
jgi:hypothetical protein